MENIIDKLLEIDRRACELVEHATQQRDSQAANLAAVREEVYTAAMDKARAKAEEYRQAVREGTARQAAALAAGYEKNRAALERAYNDGCSGWVDTIVQHCTQL